MQLAPTVRRAQSNQVHRVNPRLCSILSHTDSRLRRLAPPSEQHNRSWKEVESHCAPVLEERTVASISTHELAALLPPPLPIRLLKLDAQVCLATHS